MYRNPYLSGRYGQQAAMDLTVSSDSDADQASPTQGTGPLQAPSALPAEVADAVNFPAGHRIVPLGVVPLSTQISRLGRADLGFASFPDAAHMTLSVFRPTPLSVFRPTPSPSAVLLRIGMPQEAPTGSVAVAAAEQRSGAMRDAAVSALIAETEAAMRLAHVLLAEPAALGTASVETAATTAPAVSPRPAAPEAAAAVAALTEAPPTMTDERVLEPSALAHPRGTAHGAPPWAHGSPRQPTATPAATGSPITGAPTSAPSAETRRPPAMLEVKGSQRDETPHQAAAASDILTVFYVRPDEIDAILAKRLSRRLKAAKAVEGSDTPAVQANGSAGVATDAAPKSASKRRSSDRRRRDDEKKKQASAVPPAPVMPISAVTELVSSIVALINKRADPEVKPPAAPPALYIPPQLPPELLKAPAKVLPPPQVVMGQPPLFSHPVDPIRSPYFAAAAASAVSAPAAAVAPAAQVLASVMLPRVGLHDATVPKAAPSGGTGSSNRTNSPTASASPLGASGCSAAAAQYLRPTESWLSKGPELQGVHLHLKKASLRPPSSVGSVFTPNRVSDFNHRAKEHLRLHRSHS